MKKVLFVCGRNSCRSQMAEGLARTLAGGRWEVYSAGVVPGTLDPRAVQVMREIGIDISGQKPKAVDTYLLASADLVVTLCGEAEEVCAVVPPEVERQHWPLPDPSSAQGDEEEILRLYREVRDEIGRRIVGLLK